MPSIWASDETEKYLESQLKLRIMFLRKREMVNIRGSIIRFYQSVRRRQWHPTPVLLPGKSHGWRSLLDCCPWGCEESDVAERLHFHFSLLCIGEGNGNPLQCSCLENPRDGVAQRWTQLKWFSSSSIRVLYVLLIRMNFLRPGNLSPTIFSTQWPTLCPIHCKYLMNNEQICLLIWGPCLWEG